MEYIMLESDVECFLPFVCRRVLLSVAVILWKALPLVCRRVLLSVTVILWEALPFVCRRVLLSVAVILWKAQGYKRDPTERM